MLRSQTTLIGILALALAILWGLDGCHRHTRDELRLRDSTLAPLEAEGTIALDDVERVELLLAGSGTSWSYRRDAIGWRLPGYREAFAVTSRLEAVLDAVISGRGTVVGTYPEDAEHFGVTPEAGMQVALFDRQDELLTTIRAGHSAPGASGAESYMRVEGRREILHMNANARTSVDGTPDGPYPPLLDRRVIPEALGRRAVVAVGFSGPRASRLRSILREELPPDPTSFRGPDSGPRYEWYGTVGAGTRQRLDDRAARTAVERIVSLPFDEILGDRAALEDPSGAPLLVATLDYEHEIRDVLELHPAGSREGFAIYNRTTRQLFRVGTATATALTPDPEALRPGDPAGPDRP